VETKVETKTDILAVVERIAYQATDAALKGDPHPIPVPYPVILRAAKKGIVRALLEHTGWNQSRAAELGGLNRATLRTITRS